MEQELTNGRVAGEMTEARKEARRAPSAANLLGTATRTKEAPEAKETARAMARARARVEQDIPSIAESKGISE